MRDGAIFSPYVGDAAYHANYDLKPLEIGSYIPSTFFIVQWTIEDFSTVDSFQLKAGLHDAAAILSLGPIVLVGVAGMVQGKPKNQIEKDKPNQSPRFQGVTRSQEAQRRPILKKPKPSTQRDLATHFIHLKHEFSSQQSISNQSQPAAS